MEKITIYILRYECDYYWIIYNLFQELKDRYYVQYINKWEKLYSIKYWSLEELVWEYPFSEKKLKVTLIKREITI